MNEQFCTAQQAAALAPLSGRAGTIAKTTTQQKPVIRIVHLVAPEIIKTDADNFRELVQRLTGKQQPAGSCVNAAKARFSKLCRRNKKPAATRSSPTIRPDGRKALSPTAASSAAGCVLHGKLLSEHDRGGEVGKMHELELWMGDEELPAVAAATGTTTTSSLFGDVEGLFCNVPTLMFNPVMSYSSASSSSLMDDSSLENRRRW